MKYISLILFMFCIATFAQINTGTGGGGPDMKEKDICKQLDQEITEVEEKLLIEYYKSTVHKNFKEMVNELLIINAFNKLETPRLLQTESNIKKVKCNCGKLNDWDLLLVLYKGRKKVCKYTSPVAIEQIQIIVENLEME